MGAAPTTLTSCTGTSVTAACARAARTAATLATAATKTAPLPPTETKVGIKETATPPAQTSIRVTTAPAGATTPRLGWGVRISSARLCSLRSLLGCSLSWLSSLPLSSHPSWGLWGKHLILLPPQTLLLQAFNLQGNCEQQDLRIIHWSRGKLVVLSLYLLRKSVLVYSHFYTF